MKTRIEEAYRRIAPVVRETPVEQAAALDAVYKLEHLQHTGSFKFRGACNKISLMTKEECAAGVVAASNGNHGLGVAAAARARGIAAEVFVSAQVSPSKAERISRFGAHVTVAGDDSLSAELSAREAAAASGRIFISPYNDLDVAAGQGTIGIELVRQVPGLDALFVAAGGGGLIGGIGAYLKAVSPGTRIIGCWPEASPVLLRCMEAGRVIDVPEEPTISESTSGGLEPGSVTVELCKRVIDRPALVSEGEIVDAMRLVKQTDHWLIEGAAGVAVAAFRRHAREYRNRSVAILLCGRNLSPKALAALDS
jgi:threonine dehydratase